MSDSWYTQNREDGSRGLKRSLYRSIADSLRRDLVSGRLTPGAKLPPVRNLAHRFDVSVITISKALRALEREGYLKCIPAVGAFVHGRNAGNAQVTIAFATVAIETALTGLIATGIEEACRRRGWLLQIHRAQAEPGGEGQSPTRLLKTGSRGAIVLLAAGEANVEALFRLKFSNFPLVLVDRRIPGIRLDLVESNHERGGYLATRHLLQHGHRHILMLTSRPGLFTSADERARGYEQALLECGIQPRPEWKLTYDDLLGEFEKVMDFPATL